MNTLREQWVKALKSGQYRQARYRLVRGYRKKGYCCLGVVCKVAECEVVEYRGMGLVFDTPDGAQVSGLGPRLLSRLFPEISTRNREHFQQLLSYLNDCRGYSFWQIADFVEHVFSLPLHRVCKVLAKEDGHHRVSVQKLLGMEPEDAP